MAAAAYLLLPTQYVRRGTSLEERYIELVGGEFAGEGHTTNYLSTLCHCRCASMHLYMK